MIQLAQDVIDRSDLVALAEWLVQDPPPHLTQGPLVERFEEAFAKHLGRKHAVFVNSGSSANLIGYWALKLRIGGTPPVLAPAIAWATTVMPPVQFGWWTGLVDGDRATWGMDPKRLEEALDKLEAGRDPSHFTVVSLVHVLGVPALLDRILELKRKYHFWLLEDACASLGSTYRGKKIGTAGDVSTFSFYFGHQLSTIEGGFAVTDDDELDEYLRMARAHGWAADLKKHRQRFYRDSYVVDPFREKFTFYVDGFNVRGTDLQAFLGLRQLEKAAHVYEERARVARTYREILRGADGLTFQADGADSGIVPIGFGLLARDAHHRARIGRTLQRIGCESRPIGGGNMARQPFWSGEKTALPVADALHDRGLQLPCHPGLTAGDVQAICDAVRGAL